MTDQDTPQDAISGFLRLTFGEEERLVPTLKLGASRAWFERQVRKAPLLIDQLRADLDEVSAQRAFLDFTYEAGLEAVLEYDVTGVLGGREWLEEHADPTQLYEVLRRMARVAIPFGNDLATLMALLLAINPTLLGAPEEEPAKAAASASPRSTSSRSGSGTCRPRRSRRSSTRGS